MASPRLSGEDAELEVTVDLSSAKGDLETDDDELTKTYLGSQSGVVPSMAVPPVVVPANPVPSIEGAPADDAPGPVSGVAPKLSLPEVADEKLSVLVATYQQRAERFARADDDGPNPAAARTPSASERRPQTAAELGRRARLVRLVRMCGSGLGRFAIGLAFALALASVWLVVLVASAMWHASRLSRAMSHARTTR